MQKLSIQLFLFSIIMLSSTLVFAQGPDLEGNWIFISDVEGVEYSVMAVDSAGRTELTETYPYEYLNMNYLFDVDHTGLIRSLANNQIAYAGVGNGTARDSGGTVKVMIEAAATGIISDDANVISGVWVNKEQYTSPDGTWEDEDGSTYVMVREGFDPGTPGEALAGVWEITLESENLNWTGQVTLNPDGTLAGMFSDSVDLSAAAIPLAGLYTYSDDKEFSITYTTAPIELPVAGETTFTLSGEGQGNEDNTHIEGAWSFTVEVTDRTSRTFEGTFELTKLEESSAPGWWLY